ncbi:hypothetical protein EK21DRAFT_118922 [Setomelanomma holmii]|uniref:Heterokaryon incompatibility protein n=1 Tax=Setomelanomma holmii TaxID=210430 RepID=A0A9P4GXI7_9PLEO|nr:hypothetical protein EK21DRAFT_118922 [Setomelanomma holmii]
MPSRSTIFMGPVALSLHQVISAKAKYDTYMTYEAVKPVRWAKFCGALLSEGLVKFIDIARLKDTLGDGPPLSILEIRLYLTRRFATEDLDQIYSLIGLFRSFSISRTVTAANSIEANYDAHPSEVYTEVSRQHILSTRSLLPLSLSSAKGRYQAMPTWAIDWTWLQLDSVDINVRIWAEMHELFDASAGLNGHAPYFDDNVLQIKGLYIDEIVAIRKLGPRMREYGDFLQFLKGRDLFERYPGAIQSTWGDAWLRTLRCDCLEDRSPASPTWKLRRLADNESRLIAALQNAGLLQYAPYAGREVHFVGAFPIEYHPTWHRDPARKGRKDFEPGALTWNLEKSVQEQRRKVATNRVVFVTKQNYLGITNGCKIGDQIYILADGNLPIILRQVNGIDEYENVADCYLHGFMGGDHNKTLLEKQGGLRRLRVI